MRTYYVLGLLFVASAGAASAQSAQGPGGFPTPTFDGVDADKNGSLSLAEVTTWLTTFPNTLKPKDILDLWDENGNGSVTRKEFDNRPRPGPDGRPTR